MSKICWMFIHMSPIGGTFVFIFILFFSIHFFAMIVVHVIEKTCIEY